MKTKPGFVRHFETAVLVASSFVLFETCAPVVAAPVKGFVREPGSYELDDSSRLEISKSADGKLTGSAAWKHGKAMVQSGPPIDTQGWFAYVESSDTIWLFNGDSFSAFLRDPYGSGHGVVDGYLFETC